MKIELLSVADVHATFTFWPRNQISKILRFKKTAATLFFWLFGTSVWLSSILLSGYLAILRIFWLFSQKTKKNDYIFSLIHCFCMILHHFILLSKRLLCVTDISCITSPFNIRVGGAVVQSSPGTREVPGSRPHPGNNFFTLYFQILLDSSVIMGYSVQARNFESPERAASVFAFLYVCPFVY